MYLVIDANVVISCLIAGSWTLRVFFAAMLSKRLALISPEYLFVEIDEHFEEITGKTKLSEEELNYLLEIMEKEIRLVPVEEFEDKIEEAEEASPDPDDVAYLALALKFFCPMWSNDKRLKDQDKVTVLNTSEVSKLLGLKT